MARAAQTEVTFRIVIERPVAGVSYSLQAKDGSPLDAKRSIEGEPIAFEFPVRIGRGPKFFGDHVRREGPSRRFVYIRVGQLAGDPASPWSRRIKIDIHDIPQDLLDRAMTTGGIVETTISGTAEDGTPTCATARPAARRIVGS